MNWELGRWQHFFLILLSHFAALVILFTGSIPQISVMITMHLLNFLLSGTVTYHRLLSHRSWKSPRWFEVFGTVLGIFSFTGSSITRTIVHRQHHLSSDTEKDPHSPWHSSMIELYFPMLFYKGSLDKKLATDLLRDRFHIRIHRYYLLYILFAFFTVGTFSYFITGSFYQALLWCCAVVLGPGTFSWLTIYLGNYLCHVGKKTDEDDRSNNNLLIVLIGFGEGWHRNHHLSPKNPNFGMGKWDPGWWIIKMLQLKQ